MNLFIVGLAMFAFTACGGGETATEEAVTEEVVTEEAVTEEVVEGDSADVAPEDGHDHDHDHEDGDGHSH